MRYVCGMLLVVEHHLHNAKRCSIYYCYYYSPSFVSLYSLRTIFPRHNTFSHSFFYFFFFISQNTLYKWEQKEECSKCNYALDIIGTTQNGCDGKMQWRCSSIPEVHLRGIMRFVGDKRKKLTFLICSWDLCSWNEFQQLHLAAFHVRRHSYKWAWASVINIEWQHYVRSAYTM